MNTSPRDACQCACEAVRPGIFGRTAAGLLAAALFWLVGAQAKGQAPAPSAAGTPARAAWQQDLDAARLLEASLLAMPAKDSAETAARDERMSQIYQELAGKYPDRAAVQKACGEYALEHQHAPAAILALRHAEALDPHDPAAADLLAAADLQLGLTKDACAQWQQAVRLAPDEPRYHFELANVLYLFRHELVEPPALPDEAAVLTQALEEYRRAAELAPLDLSYAQAYAETFYIFPRPDWERARTAWKAVLALSGADTDFANGHLARVSVRMKQPAEAESYLAQIHNPAFADLKAKLHTQAARLSAAAP